MLPQVKILKGPSEINASKCLTFSTSFDRLKQGTQVYVQAEQSVNVQCFTSIEDLHFHFKQHQLIGANRE